MHGVCDRAIGHEGFHNWLTSAEPAREIPEVDMHQIADVGLNVFGLQLFVESVAGKNDAKTFDPFSFIYKGIKITMEPIRDVDTRHQ